MQLHQGCLYKCLNRPTNQHVLSLASCAAAVAMGYERLKSQGDKDATKSTQNNTTIFAQNVRSIAGWLGHCIAKTLQLSSLSNLMTFRKWVA